MSYNVSEYNNLEIGATSGSYPSNFTINVGDKNYVLGNTCIAHFNGKSTIDIVDISQYDTIKIMVGIWPTSGSYDVGFDMKFY